jgi:hypothetical protein
MTAAAPPAKAKHRLDEIDPNFEQDLENSKPAVDAVAAWLRRRGRGVYVRPVVVRPDPSVRHLYADKGDMMVYPGPIPDGLAAPPPGGTRFEGKHRPGIDFKGKTRREGFPYVTLIVDVITTWDKADPKPHAYVIANKSLTGCFVVKGATSPHWKTVTRYCAAQGRYRDYYEVGMEHVEYHAMD